jgi:hypothetical protein
MKAYSIDLRQKIIEVYEREEICQRQLAQRFGVALSFIVKLLKQYRQTKEISPKPFNGGVKLKLSLLCHFPSIIPLFCHSPNFTISKFCNCCLASKCSGIS